ncbi:Putative ribonuclease H protein [Dendrobium catenatum]|uniref:Ribonuclease H protein n=1 Tax=Dendrobium catenatum TaxID=906689 RepID=A0A2I0VGE1_9ASPA|nr:Putative ribonuclease H protein [Dendrobium catenatum]
MYAPCIISSICDKIKLFYEANIIKHQNFKGWWHVYHAFSIVNIPVVIEKRVCMVNWFKPDSSWIKLNTDGSYNGKVAGCGGILRNHLGQMIKAFDGPVKGNSALIAELKGIIYGISMCINLGYNRIWIEVDAMLILHYINNNSLFNAENYYLIRQMKQDLSNNNYKISHIYREGNGCADALAKVGCNLLEYAEFSDHDIPKVVKGLARLDRAGLPYIRNHDGIT